MSSYFGGWFGYGFGAAIGKALFGYGEGDARDKRRFEPIRQQTEAEIVADEKRYDEEAKRLDAKGGAP